MRFVGIALMLAVLQGCCCPQARVSIIPKSGVMKRGPMVYDGCNWSDGIVTTTLYCGRLDQ